MTAVGTYPRRVFRGEATRAAAMPLGGIGTGSIALCGDGSLRQWQIHNQVNHMACVPHSFFAVWSRTYRPPDEPIARVLQSAALYDQPGPPAPPTSNDNVVPLPHRRLMSQLPGVATTELTGEYPVAELRYLDESLPLTVTMEAFNPFVPLDSARSGIPAIIFNLTVANPTERRMLASVAASLQNAVGWDGVAPIFDTKCQLYGGNTNTLVRTNEVTAIAMSTSTLPEDSAGYGTMTLATTATDATYLMQWSNLHDFWDDFQADGRLSNVADTTPSQPGRTWNGALAVPITLTPGESRTVPFILAWHFPNRYVNYTQFHYFAFTDNRTKFWLGNNYSTRYRSALDVASAVAAELDELTEQTRLTRDTLFDSTLPPALIDTVTSQASIIRTPTCFWTEDGNFYGFEGCNGASTPHNEPVGGCCPLNCTHVWNYEMALSRLFPDLERTMRNVEWDLQQHPSGYLPHRVLLPTYLPRTWDQEIGGPANPALDGLLGAILKTLREYRATGDAAWLAGAWPSVKQALDYIWTAHDPVRSGVIEGEQPNTYDISIYGMNTFIGTLYLAALRAIAVMAEIQGEANLANECREVAEKGQAALEARLWNGEYYVQDVNLTEHPEQAWTTGCHIDQLLGQWWAHYLGLGHLLAPDHVRTAARSIFANNFRENFRGVVQKPRAFVTADDQGTLICTWPHGGRPEVPTQYSDEVWTGLEYELAALLLYEGEPEAAVRIVDAVRSRYDGRKQSPWNDIECGDHYVRAMASWSLLEAASGYQYDAGTDTIGFAPVISPEHFRAPFVTRDGWGTYTQETTADTLTATLALTAGELTLRTIRLAAPAGATQATLTLAGRDIPLLSNQEGSELIISLPAPVTLRPETALNIKLT